MKNKSIYIPGDLVMTNGKPIGTKKGIAYIITASDPNRTLTLKDGTVNKGVVTLNAITEEDKAHFVETSTWVKHIVPIPLTSEILEKNGWTKQTMIINEYGDKQNFFTRDDIVNIYMVKDENGYYFIPDACIKCNVGIYFVHQLQHLLFGLGLPKDLKV